MFQQKFENKKHLDLIENYIINKYISSVNIYCHSSIKLALVVFDALRGFPLGLT